LTVLLPAEGELRVRVAVDPYPTVLALLIDASTGGRSGPPTRWSHLAQRLVPTRLQGRLAPLMTLPTSGAPACLLPVCPSNDRDIGEVAECVRSISPDQLVASVRGDTEDVLARWRPVLHDPASWLALFAEAMERVAVGFADVWRSARPFLMSEIERMGGLLIRHGARHVIESSHSRYRCADGRLEIQNAVTSSGDVHCRSVTLMPVLSGRNTTMFNISDPDAMWLAYPAPPFESLQGMSTKKSSGAAKNDPLAELLGPVRASIMRLLEREFPMWEVASRVHITRATATHHCARLEKSDLIRRARAGSAVRVSRSSRGDAMVRLFADADIAVCDAG
jgi:DNA-binding MarR family transcriptional regulator